MSTTSTSPSTFAFLIHPRNAVSSDLGQLFGPPFGWVPDAGYAWAMKSLPIPPLVTGSVKFWPAAKAATTVAAPLLRDRCTPLGPDVWALVLLGAGYARLR